MKVKSKLSPFLWSGLVMVAAMALSLYTAARQKVVVEEQGIISPDVSLPPVLLYFSGSVIAVAIALFFVPLNKLKIIFRIIFTLMFMWGTLIIIWLVWPSQVDYVVYTIAIVAGLTWLFWAKIWLHDLLLLIALSAAGSVFGFFFSPWTFMIFLLLIAVYDFLAVRFGFMVWMADRMSGTAALPAFIFPRELRDWRLSISAVSVGDLAKTEKEKREYTILGGGDIAFPLMLAASVFYADGMAGAIIVSAFSLAGLMGAFLIQAIFLKGRPMPALPPIAAFSLVGLVLIRLTG
jgi:presenilin-like A22 family membrane protease